MRLTRRDRLLLFAPLAILLGGWLVVPALVGLTATLTTYTPLTTSVAFADSRNRSSRCVVVAWASSLAVAREPDRHWGHVALPV